MPIRLDFDMQTRAICMSFKIPWDWNELKTIVAQAEQITRSGSDHIHLILDLSAAGPPPSGALQNLTELMEYTQPLQGRMLVVGADRLSYSLLLTIKRVSPHARKMGEIEFFETLDEAKTTLQL